MHSDLASEDHGSNRGKVVGRKLDKNTQVIKNTDSSNQGIGLLPERYPLNVEYSGMKKATSVKTLFDRKGYSVPETSAYTRTLKFEKPNKRLDMTEVGKKRSQSKTRTGAKTSCDDPSVSRPKLPLKHKFRPAGEAGESSKRIKKPSKPKKPDPRPKADPKPPHAEEQSSASKPKNTKSRPFLAGISKTSSMEAVNKKKKKKPLAGLLETGKHLPTARQASDHARREDGDKRRSLERENREKQDRLSKSRAYAHLVKLKNDKQPRKDRSTSPEPAAPPQWAAPHPKLTGATMRKNWTERNLNMKFAGTNDSTEPTITQRRNSNSKERKSCAGLANGHFQETKRLTTTALNTERKDLNDSKKKEERDWKSKKTREKKVEESRTSLYCQHQSNSTAFKKSLNGKPRRKARGCFRGRKRGTF